MASVKVGTVTRATAGIGSASYIARSVDGVELGSFQNAADAMDAVRKLSTGEKVLRWNRSDLAGIENYIGYKTTA